MLFDVNGVLRACILLLWIGSGLMVMVRVV